MWTVYIIGNASVNSGLLLVVKCLGNQKLYVDFQLHWGGAGVGAPNPYIVQGSTVFGY